MNCGHDRDGRRDQDRGDQDAEQDARPAGRQRREREPDDGRRGDRRDDRQHRDQRGVGDQPGHVQEAEDAGQVVEARRVRQEGRGRRVELVERLEGAGHEPHERQRERDDHGDGEDRPPAAGHDSAPRYGTRRPTNRNCERGQQQDHREHDDRHRRPVPELAVSERRLERVQGGRERRVVRTAARQDVARREDLRGGDPVDDREVEGHRQQGRPGHVPEPGTRARRRRAPPRRAGPGARSPARRRRRRG